MALSSGDGAGAAGGVRRKREVNCQQICSEVDEAYEDTCLNDCVVTGDSNVRARGEWRGGGGGGGECLFFFFFLNIKKKKKK